MPLPSFDKSNRKDAALMDQMKRTLAKALCWQALGVAVMTGLGYLFTGSASTGGALALSSAALSSVFYIIHEQIWARIAWGLPAAGREAPRETPLAENSAS